MYANTYYQTHSIIEAQYGNGVTRDNTWFIGLFENISRFDIDTICHTMKEIGMNIIYRYLRH